MLRCLLTYTALQSPEDGGAFYGLGALAVNEPSQQHTRQPQPQQQQQQPQQQQRQPQQDEQQAPPATMRDLIARVTSIAEQKALATAAALPPPPAAAPPAAAADGNGNAQPAAAHRRYPTATEPGGRWELVGPSHWMAGLWSGVLWMVYDLGGRSKQIYKDLARASQAGLAGRQRDFGTQHDLGECERIWWGPEPPSACLCVRVMLHAVALGEGL